MSIPSPRTPPSAERARTIAIRGGKAALVPATATATRVTPLLYHVHSDGGTTILLDDEHPLIAEVNQALRRELPAMLELVDPAPVPLREPVRGLLWITGRLWLPNAQSARQAVLDVAEVRPDPRLLDAGHGATVLRLTPASMVLADAETSAPLLPAEFAEAHPDPFCHYEDDWLRHLEMSHRDVVAALRRHLPHELQGGHVRPLGLDRFGLRLRVEAEDVDHDVRLSFAHPVATAQELGAELRRLLGCPFLTESRQG